LNKNIESKDIEGRRKGKNERKRAKEEGKRKNKKSRRKMTKENEYMRHRLIIKFRFLYMFL
jgi:hypothetical protein